MRQCCRARGAVTSIRVYPSVYSPGPSGTKSFSRWSCRSSAPRTRSEPHRFNPGEIDGLLAIPDEERANATPPVPENPVSRVGDLWVCGKHRVLCGDATRSEDVARLLGERRPILMVTDPPYGIELDSEWRDRAGLNGCGPAEASYMKRRTQGHTETTISGDTRADWSAAFRALRRKVGNVTH